MCSDFHEAVETFDSKGEDITILHVNIRSVRKHWDIFQLDIKNCKIKWDLICLTEIGIKRAETQLYWLDGYEPYWLTRESTSRGGGIVLLVNNAINENFVKFKNVKLDTNDTIVADLHIKDVHLTVLAIYRQPNSNIKKFAKELNLLLREFEKNDNIVVLGDTNIDILDENQDNVEQKSTEKYLNVLAANGFRCKIDSPTRVEIYANRLTKSCIDHIFVKTKELNSTGVCVEKKLADHYYTAVQIEIREHVAEEICDEIVTSLNHFQIVKSMQDVDWKFLDQHAENPNIMYNEIRKKIASIYNNNKVTKKVKLSKARNPWVRLLLIY